MNIPSQPFQSSSEESKTPGSRKPLPRAPSSQHTDSSDAQQRQKLKYAPGSVFYQAKRFAGSAPGGSNLSSSVSGSAEVIVSELENPRTDSDELLWCGFAAVS